MEARLLLWLARLNLGTLVNLAWIEHCTDRKAPRSPEAHNRTDIVNFLSTVVWSNNVLASVREEPTLTGVREADSICPDWERSTALAGLAQTRCIIWLLEGPGRGCFQGTEIVVADRWRNFCWQNNLDRNLPLGLISHEDSLTFLRNLGRACGVSTLDDILATTLEDGLQTIAPPMCPPDEPDDWGDASDAILFAIQGRDEVLTDYIDLAPPLPPPLQCNAVTDLVAAGDVTQDWAERPKLIEHVMTEFVRTSSPDAARAWSTWCNKRSYEGRIHWGSARDWDAEDLVEFLQEAYGDEVPPDGIPTRWPWDGKRARLASVLRALMWQYEWVRDKWLAVRRHSTGIPDTQWEYAHSSETLSAMLRYVGVTFAKHPLLQSYDENYGNDPNSYGPSAPAQPQGGAPRAADAQAATTGKLRPGRWGRVGMTVSARTESPSPRTVSPTLSLPTSPRTEEGGGTPATHGQPGDMAGDKSDSNNPGPTGHAAARPEAPRPADTPPGLRRRLRGRRRPCPSPTRLVRRQS